MSEILLTDAADTHTGAEAPPPDTEAETNREISPSELTARDFVSVVMKTLAARSASSICRECGRAAGWRDWEIVPAPVVLAVAIQGAQAGTVLLVCRQCGYCRFYSLGALGIKPEERRIVTPG